MAGSMNARCLEIRMLLTECLMLDRPLPPEPARHLRGCAECAREAEDVRRVVRTLRSADFPVIPAVDRNGTRPGDLGERIGREVAAVRRTRRRRLALGVAAAALAACSTAVAWSIFHDGAPPPRTVGLVREGRMILQPWGTEVPIVLSGLEPGQTYRMMTLDAVGRSTPAGSVRATAVDSAVHTRMVTGMSRDSIRTLLVEDSRGRSVARLAVAPPPSAAPPSIAE